MHTVKLRENLPQLHTPEELAAVIHYHPESIRRAIRQHRIRAIKFGNEWRIPDAEFERILEEGLPA